MKVSVPHHMPAVQCRFGAMQQGCLQRVYAGGRRSIATAAAAGMAAAAAASAAGLGAARAPTWRHAAAAGGHQLRHDHHHHHGAVRAVAAYSRSMPRAHATAAEAPASATTTTAAVGGRATLSQQAAVSGVSFQDAISRLERYWSGVAGCTVCLPHSTEVGAGTMNPATFLRVLGPEPWNVCYVEPSHRPDDSRYGINPNRVQRHTQFQVILKPPPRDPQEMFLGSLEAIGVDTGKHDIRFVEDNWESPVLGAWGLGWEVWLDGMEVTQFTYFQQSGGLPCKPVAVEITYGLERILMALQGVTHFKDIRYSEGMTYGELMMQNEQEMSTYNLDAADVAAQRTRFDLYEAEANSMLLKRLPVPAYDHVLKASHAFNVMDARGAVGVTERQKLFARMRSLTRKVSLLWMERRNELGLPLLAAAAEEGDAQAEGGADWDQGDGAAPDADAADFVLEIGSEELPADYVSDGISALSLSFPQMLERLDLAHGGVRVEGTPRRLVVRVRGLATRQPDRTERVRGPPLRAAFDADGNATKAAAGFARKNGIEVDALERDADYVWATVSSIGKSAADVLGGEIAVLIASIRWKKSMRWQEGDSAWPRPLRWLLAVHGDRHIRFSALDVCSGKTTRGIRRRRQSIADVRNEELDVIAVPSAGSYDEAMGAEKIILDEAARRKEIWEASQALVAKSGGDGASIPAGFGSGLLDEVANLVESPVPLIGAFDEGFLKLPREVLETVMKKHQRYFPVADASTGALKPLFVTVANGDCDPSTVVAGNEAVLRARYEDAKFFYESDIGTPLLEFRPRLKGMMFQESLGTMLDRADRTEAIVRSMVDAGGLADTMLDDDARETARLAAPLMYADLATTMVTEFTGLAGIMGRHYALAQGGAPDVCDAVFESVLPRQAGDQLPQTAPGSLLSVASRLDSLVGLFAAGCAPSASADPYGLRRIAYGLVETLIASGMDVDVTAAMAVAASEQPIEVPASALEEAAVFLRRRLEQLMIDRGHNIELVRAVLGSQGNRPAAAMRAVEELAPLLESRELAELIEAVARPVRILRSRKDGIGVGGAVDESLFEKPEETDLWRAFGDADRLVRSAGNAEEAIRHAHRSLVGPINRFFDGVLVMSDDEAVRRNRFALLAKVAGVTDSVLDLSLLPGF